MRLRLRQPSCEDEDVATFVCTFLLGHVLCLPGSVTIRPGRIEMLPVTWRRTAQTHPQVAVVRSRTMPWPLRTAIDLTGERGIRSVRVLPRYGGITGMVATLEANGFTVDERRVWFLPL